MNEVYVTRDPLKGVELASARSVETMPSGYVRLTFRIGNRAFDEIAYCEGRDWHITLVDAERRMLKMRKARIRSIKRELKKLQQLVSSQKGKR